jgi:O-antigen/teichoic acid export membrane protein
MAKRIDPMSQLLPGRAGSALVWKLVQLVGVKLIFLVRLFVLGWMLGPGEFGLFAVSLVALDFLLRITNFGMVPALVQRQAAERRHYDAAWTVGLLRAGLVTAVVFAIAPLVADLFREPRATDLIRVLAFRPLLEAGASIGVAELIRQLRFKPLAWIQLSEAVVNTVVSIALVNSLGVWALVAGPLAGAVASLIVSYIMAPHRPRILLDGSAIRPLMRFGGWIFATALIGTLGNSMLQLAMGRRLGAAELGVYFLAGKLAFLPSEIATELVGAVAFPLYARLQNDPRQATRAFQLIFIGTVAVLLPAALLLFVLAPSLVEHLLSDRWQGTAPAIRVLVWVNIVGLAGGTIVPMLKGVGQPSRVTVLELVQSGMLIILAWELAGRYGAVGAGLSWLLATGVSQMLALYFLRRLIPHAWSGMGRALTAVVVAALAGAGAAWGITRWETGTASLIAAAGLGPLVTAGLLWTQDRLFGLRFGETLTRAFPQVLTTWALLTGFRRASSPVPPSGGID